MKEQWADILRTKGGYFVTRDSQKKQVCSDFEAVVNALCEHFGKAKTNTPCPLPDEPLSSSWDANGEEEAT